MIRITIFIVLIFTQNIILAQTKNEHLIQEIINSDSSLFPLRFHPKIIELNEEKVCEKIAFLFKEKKSEFYEKYNKIFSDSTLKREKLNLALDSLINLNDIWDLKVEKDSIKYAFLCSSNYPKILSQIKCNNKLKRHSKNSIPRGKKVIQLTGRNTKAYFRVSNPIFLDSEKAIVWINIVWGFQYGYKKLMLYEKDATNKWKRKEVVLQM